MSKLKESAEKASFLGKSNREVVIIDYGAGNIQSIKFALQRLGYTAILSNNAKEIEAASKVIFPGVGEAGSAMKKLKESGLDKLIPNLKQPVLGICLGMQLMCNSSEEGNTKGLGIFNCIVKKFVNNTSLEAIGKEEKQRLKIPQIGWNKIYNLQSYLFNPHSNNPKDTVKENEYMYLIHSYYVPVCKNAIAITKYGVEYSSALQKDNFYGVQFHPEKSGKIGSRILSNFLSIPSKQKTINSKVETL